MEFRSRYVEGYPGVSAMNGTILVDDDGLAFERKGQRRFAILFADITSVHTASTVDLYGKTAWNSVATPWGLQPITEAKTFVVVRCRIAGVVHDVTFVMRVRGLWAEDNSVQAALSRRGASIADGFAYADEHLRYRSTLLEEQVYP